MCSTFTFALAALAASSSEMAKKIKIKSTGNTGGAVLVSMISFRSRMQEADSGLQNPFISSVADVFLPLSALSTLT